MPIAHDRMEARNPLEQPDKQVGKTDEQLKAAIEGFQTLAQAYDVLGDPLTRREYDKARDKLQVKADMGLHDWDKPVDKPTPTCIEVEVSLHQLYRGVHKKAIFHRRQWDHRRQVDARVGASLTPTLLPSSLPPIR